MSQDQPRFGTRLQRVFETAGPLCVGIDPHGYLLREWGLPDTAEGAAEFGALVVAAATGRVGIVKPQVAFFERFGAAGYTALERVIRSARENGLLVIADAKRGDVGSSVEAYGEAWLGEGSPLESDAMTISAFQGVGSIEAPMRLAESAGKGLFVLAATSNPEAARIQQARVATQDDGPRALASTPSPLTVARVIIDEVMAFNQGQPPTEIGSIGVVLGATLELSAFGIDTATSLSRNAMPVLAPGFGHQGAQLSDAKAIFGSFAETTIVSESRGVLGAGPAGLADAIERRADEVRSLRG